MMAFETVDGPAALQELYGRLDNIHNGDKLLAWYGQERASGRDHAAALVATIKQYRLDYVEWYRKRFPDEVPAV